MWYKEIKTCTFAFVFKLRFPGQADVPIMRNLNVRAWKWWKLQEMSKISHVYTGAVCAKQHLQWYTVRSGVMESACKYKVVKSLTLQREAAQTPPWRAWALASSFLKTQTQASLDICRLGIRPAVAGEY